MDLNNEFPFINPNILNYITQRMIDYYKEDGDLLGDDIDLNTNELWQSFLIDILGIYKNYVIRLVLCELDGNQLGHDALFKMWFDGYMKEIIKSDWCNELLTLFTKEDPDYYAR